MPKYSGDITLASSVKDLDRSIAWFEEMLGFELVVRIDDAQWAELTSTTANVTIGLGVNESVTGQGGTTPVFGVQDIVIARNELEAKEVKFDGDTVEVPGMVKIATFFDPDGNSYMFAESLM